MTDHSTRLNPPPPGESAMPVIAMMEDHFVVNMVVRTRAKARALRRMIELSEQLLPETETPEGGKEDQLLIARAIEAAERRGREEMREDARSIAHKVGEKGSYSWRRAADEIEEAIAALPLDPPTTPPARK